MNFICILALPYYYCVKDKMRLEWMTKMIMMVNYVLHLVVTLVFFVALNALLLPFAYLKTCVIKMCLMFKRTISTCEFFFFFIFGAPLLVVSQLTDLVYFIRWSLDTKKPFKE